MNVNKKKILILIPTFNEKKNINRIINKIKKSVKLKYDILFVDDNSTDGTKKIFNNIKLKNIFIFNRKEKLGVGSAHKAGIKYGYRKKYRFIITMDCDGTHDPKYINKIVKLLNKSDLIITDRFQNKNSLSGWNIYRKFITTFRHIFVTFIFNTNLDSSGAFRCYDTKKIKLKDIMLAKSNSYSFFTESTVILYTKNYKINQIPVILPKRHSGSSKMKFMDVVIGFLYTLLIFFRIKLTNIYN